MTNNSSTGRTDNRVVVVTGGGTGIGRSTALTFAASGAHVVVVARRPEPLSKVAAEHPAISPLPADVADPADAQQVIDATTSRWGRLDVLVNNAGIFAAMPAAEADGERIRDLCAVNVIAPSMLTRAALPHLQTGGVIINVSSSLAARPSPGAANYAATKAALNSLTRTWATELAGRGVRVNGVAPGPTESEALAASGLPAEAVEQIKRDEASRIPLGRRGEPDEVAHWIRALASPDAPWVTGQILAVDGGLSLT